MSHDVGKALKEWLENVLQNVDVWLSSEDLRKGTTWVTSILTALKTSRCCIVCLTSSNPDASPWMLFEVGALTAVEGSRIFTFLHGLDPERVKYPLAMFQHTLSHREDVRKLLISLNEQLGSHAVEDRRLNTAFDKNWPDLEIRLHAIASPVEGAEPEVTVKSELIEEVRPHRTEKLRETIMSGLSDKLREVGLRIEQMSMPSETRGGISIKFNGSWIELSIGEAADFLDGILSPVELLSLVTKRGASSARPQLDLQPSTGPAPEQRLHVTNNGEEDTFLASCEILSVRNDPNKFRGGSFPLGWAGSLDRSIKLGSGQTEVLVIGRSKNPHSFSVPLPTAEISLCELSTAGFVSFDSWRWTVEPDASLPECTIRVTVRAAQKQEPVVRDFVFMPAGSSGGTRLLPLERRGEATTFELGPDTGS